MSTGREEPRAPAVTPWSAGGGAGAMTPVGTTPGASWRVVGVAVAAAVVGALPIALAAGMDGRLPMLLIAALLAAVGGAGIIAFANAHVLSRLLFFALVALAYVPYDKYLRYVEHAGGWPGLRVGAADLALLPLLPIVAIGWWLGRVRNVVPRSVIVVYALLLAQYVLATLGAQQRNLAFYELVAAVHAIVLALVAGALYRRAALVPILVATAFAVTVHAAGGVAEKVLGRPIGQHSAVRTVLEEVLATGASRVRPSGLFVHPIVLADFFLLTLPMLAAAAFAAPRAWQRWMFTLAAVAGAGMLGLTLSRGAWLSTAFAALVLLILAAREGLLDAAARRRLFRLSVVALLGALAFAPVAYQRFANSDPGNVKVRLDLNEIAFSMMRAHPLAGVGLNNFMEAMGPYDPKDVASYFPAPAHNLYLLEAAEAGVPALVLFVAFVGTVCVAASRRLRAVRHTADRLTRWVAAGLLASFWGLALSQLADFSWRLEPLRTIVWIQVGLMFAMLSHDRKPAAAPADPQEGP